MKIVHALGWYFPDSLGGTEVYVAALCEHLRARGHECLVAAPDPKLEDERSYEHEGVEVYRYPIPSAPTRAEAQGRAQVRGTELFHRWLERSRPDVFHCHSLVTGLGLHEIEAAKTLGAKVVLTCHTPSLGYVCQRGTMLRWGRELCDGLAVPAKCAACELQHRGLPESVARIAGHVPLALSSLADRIPGRLGTALGMPALISENQSRQRRLLESVDSFVVLTEWARRVVSANHGTDEKLTLNRLGIELRNAAPPVGQPRNAAPVRFGFIGRVHPTKGVFVLAEALSRLSKSLSFTLELRGPATGEEDQRTLSVLRDRIGSDPRVSFQDAVSHEEVGVTLATYDVLLCPSIWLEGGPTVALEAQAVGTPVVGSRIGGLAEAIRDGVDGALVPPGDAEALARSIERIASEPSVLERWRANLPRPRTMADVTRDYAAIYDAMVDIRSEAVVSS